MLFVSHYSTMFSSTHSEVLVIHVQHFLSVGLLSGSKSPSYLIQPILLDPTHDIGKAIAEAEAAGRGKYP